MTPMYQLAYSRQSKLSGIIEETNSPKYKLLTSSLAILG
jgi:hypothetical protein